LGVREFHRWVEVVSGYGGSGRVEEEVEVEATIDGGGS
jgi:hypothetical protein